MGQRDRSDRLLSHHTGFVYPVSSQKRTRSDHALEPPDIWRQRILGAVSENPLPDPDL